MNRYQIVVAVTLMFVGALIGVSAEPMPKPMDYSKQFVLCVYETPEEFEIRTDKTTKGQTYWQQWGAFHQELIQAGVLRGGIPLRLDADTKSLRLIDGKAVVENGKDSKKEQLSGFFILEVENMSAALNWAAKVPNANVHRVEVRPGFGMPTK